PDPCGFAAPAHSGGRGLLPPCLSMGACAMNVLVLNAGSSTLKFALHRFPAGAPPQSEERIASGVIDRVGSEASTLSLRTREAQEQPSRPIDARTMRQVVEAAIQS